VQGAKVITAVRRMRAAGVRGDYLAPRPVPRQAAEYFSSVPVGDGAGEVSIQRYCHLAVVCTENLNADVVMVKSTKYRG
jgi:hypothetical protein